MNELLLIAGMAAVTFLVRYPVLVLVSKIPLPDRVFRALRYVPPAVLAAIIVPSVLMPNGESIDVAPTNSYLVAGIVSALIAWRTKNLLLTIVIGMAVFLVWRLVVGA
jgi:branched-subunit amino acid transport protein